MTQNGAGDEGGEEMNSVYATDSETTIVADSHDELQEIGDLLGTSNQTTQNCEQNTVQLGNLLSYACGNVADTSNCRRNFLQAIRANNNQPSISQLVLYADIYFAETQYNECADIIDVATPSINGMCVSGYCDFVRCLRRISSDLLIAQCYLEASMDNDAEEQEDQVILYKNITSCILATARCSRLNPITGQPQTNRFIIYDSFKNPVSTFVPLYNSLQINQAGDLRIIALPSTTSIQRYLCPYEFNLRETSWMEYNC